MSETNRPTHRVYYVDVDGVPHFDDTDDLVRLVRELEAGGFSVHCIAIPPPRRKAPARVEEPMSNKLRQAHLNGLHAMAEGYSPACPLCVEAALAIPAADFRILHASAYQIPVPYDFWEDCVWNDCPVPHASTELAAGSYPVLVGTREEWAELYGRAAYYASLSGPDGPPELVRSAKNTVRAMNRAGWLASS